MINNFEKINNYLNFQEGYFYYIQLLARKKDNPEQKHVKVIKNFYIDDEEYYWKIEDHITDICDYFNARAYIRLNIRSYEQTALNQLKLLADYISSYQYVASRSAFSKAAGRFNAQEDKIWVIDLDNEQQNMKTSIQMKIDELQTVIQKDYSILGEIQTPNGLHILSNPFNLQVFHEEFPEIDVKKDNPTILYAP